MLRDELFGGNPFADLNLDDVEPDLAGWGSTHPIFRTVIEHYRPRTVIEVGTWKGASAIHMAGLLKEADVAAEIVCVDTWLGAPLVWTKKPGELKPSMRLRGGYPQLYYTFARNVLDAGADDMITPLPSASEGGHTVLSHFGVRADLIYIDADHDHAPCYRDFENYLELLTPEGVMIGDDFGTFDGVTSAATAFADTHDLHAIALREKIVFSRIDIAARLQLDANEGYVRTPRKS